MKHTIIILLGALLSFNIHAQQATSLITCAPKTQFMRWYFSIERIRNHINMAPSSKGKEFTYRIKKIEVNNFSSKVVYQLDKYSNEVDVTYTTMGNYEGIKTFKTLDGSMSIDIAGQASKVFINFSKSPESQLNVQSKLDWVCTWAY